MGVDAWQGSPVGSSLVASLGGSWDRNRCSNDDRRTRCGGRRCCRKDHWIILAVADGWRFDSDRFQPFTLSFAGLPFEVFSQSCSQW